MVRKEKSAGHRMPFPDPASLGLNCITEWGLVTGSEARPLGFHVNDGFEITWAGRGFYSWELESGKVLEIAGGQGAITGFRSRHRGFRDRIRGGGRLLYLVYNPGDGDPEQSTPFTPEEGVLLKSRYEEIADRVFTLPASWQSLFSLLMNSMMDSSPSHPGLKYQAAALIAQLPDLVLRQGPMDGSFDNSSSVRTPKRSDRKASGELQLVAKLLEEELEIGCDPDVKLTVEAAAEIVGISRNRLYELFVKEKGMAPSGWFLQKRCDRAATLLTEGNESVASIAFACGFSSGQHLSRAFKQIHGYTPREFRRRFGEG
jgi:AraC-like DNA-binding protein